MAFEDMSIADLADFCILKHIFVDPYKHKDFEKCKEEVKRQWESRVAQVKADKSTGAEKEKEEVDELLKLNELPPRSESPEININQQKIAAAIKKGGDAAKASGVAEDAALPPAADEDLLV
jgi:hypothetical protein